MSDLADLDEALVRATQDPRTADGVRRYYQEWLLDEPLLAPRVMLKHTAFDAFVRDS